MINPFDNKTDQEKEQVWKDLLSNSEPEINPANAAEQVTPNYISEQMQALGLHQSDLVKELGINKASISAYLSGQTNLSKAGKAMFYYYFEYKKSCQK